MDQGLTARTSGPGAPAGSGPDAPGTAGLTDHRWPGYSPGQRADLERVLAFNRQLVQAIDSGRDVSAVIAALDPDPLRYMWVDEGGGQIAGLLERASALLAQAPALAGHRSQAAAALPGASWASRPAVARSRDGRAAVASIRWRPELGETIAVQLVEADGTPGADVELTEPGDRFRPVAVFDSADRLWVFYGASAGGAVSVRARRLEEHGWSAEQIVSDTSHPSFNQEVTAHPDGSVECCWQAPHQGSFAIFRRTWTAGAWAPAELLADPGAGTCWDPAVAALPGGGSGYAYSRYERGSYAVVVTARPAAGPSWQQEIRAAGRHALHPSLAVTPDGRIWCALDELTVRGHGSSGPTRLRATEELGREALPGTRPPGRHVPPELLPDVSTRIRVLLVGAAEVRDASAGLAPGQLLAPAGLPRLAAAGDGGLVLAYRVLRRLPLMSYYWEAVAQVLGPRGWSGVIALRGSDGGPEEVAICGAGAAAVVAWQTDNRKAKALTWTEGFGGWECLALREHHGEVIWHALQDTGRLALARVAGDGPAAGASRLPPARPQSPLAGSRRWAGADRAARHQTTVGGRRLTLYWGDLHRHSLISRCTAGDEPSLHDLYRYSWDVCDYDFWAVTDHSENSSAYQWWNIQKIADLFRADGRFVPLYGFEWTADTGHHNVIYGDVPRGAPIFSAFAAGSKTPAELWEQLRKHPGFEAITIPHHPGSAMVPFDWTYHDETYVRLVEIFQACRGNYEDDGCFRQYADGTHRGSFVLDGLRHGRRFGFIASSDHGNGASYLGAYCESLDRAAVFAALRDRRTFAATTRDIIVDFRCGDTFMGSELRSHGPVTFQCLTRAYTEIARVELVRNGTVIAALEGQMPLPAGWLRVPVRVEWGRGEIQDWSGRAEVDGGEILQTRFWSPDVDAIGPTSVAWTSHLRNLGEPYGAQRGGVEFTVLGPPHARLEVTTASARAAAPLATLQHAVVHGQVKGRGQLSLQPGLGGLAGTGKQEHALTWTDAVTQAAWYYVRVVLIDGEMAWSSPIWVDPG